MRVRVKICGLTTPEAVASAVAAGADALGFVFSPSVRRVTAERAAELAAGVPEDIARVAVFRHPTADEVRDVLARFAPDCVQSDAADEAVLPEDARVRFVPVLRLEPGTPSFAVPRTDGPVLLEGPASGTGRTIDWEVAATLARRVRLVLAGGLSADNVGEAIRRVRPWGVDVSSGVEARPGIKCPEKIGAFVAAARRAAEEGEA